MSIFVILFWISAFVIFYAMIGYPILLSLIDKIKKPGQIVKDADYKPTVTIMVVAHNEERVIAKKIDNILCCDYPHDSLDILVASDNSDDGTNEIVLSYIEKYPDRNIRLHVSANRLGKTNAQNEAQATVRNEILIMTDANSLFKKNAVKELVACFAAKNNAYVCGKLVYTNDNTAISSKAESAYWNIDLKMRDIESRLRTITAGNGAIYACRNSEYIQCKPIECHDSSMPLYYGIAGRRAVFNPDAIAYEKAGETIGDEFKRKIRMNRMIVQWAVPNIKTMNIKRCGLFGFFYFGHRTCRYQLWAAHLILFVSSIILSLSGSVFYLSMLLGQVGAGMLIGLYAIKPVDISIIRMAFYYGMTIAAQFVGVYKYLTGQVSSVWEKAESTR